MINCIKYNIQTFLDLHFYIKDFLNRIIIVCAYTILYVCDNNNMITK